MRIMLLSMLTVSALARVNPFGIYNTSATSDWWIKCRVFAQFAKVGKNQQSVKKMGAERPKKNLKIKKNRTQSARKKMLYMR